MASLYERVGGLDPLVRIVDSGYNKMKSHPEMGRTFEKFANSPKTFQKLKDKTVEYLGAAWGGPAYEGPDLYISHATMDIGVKVFDVLLEMFEECFQDEGLHKEIISECMESIRGMRDPICDPDGIFAKDFDERMEALSRAREERTAFYKKFNIKYSKLTFLSADPRYHEVPKGWRKKGFKLDDINVDEAKTQDSAKPQGEASSAPNTADERKSSPKVKAKGKAAAETLASATEAKSAAVEPALTPLAPSEVATKSGEAEEAEAQDSVEATEQAQECERVQSDAILNQNVEFVEPPRSQINDDAISPATDEKANAGADSLSDKTARLSNSGKSSTDQPFAWVFSCSACEAHESGADAEEEPVRRDI